MPMWTIARDLRSDIKRPADFPLPGPSAYAELMDGVELSGVGLGGYHNYWSPTCGIPDASCVALGHKSDLEAIRHGLMWDGLAGRALAMFEFLSRRVLQIQRAVKRSPKHPNFTGLEAMLSSALDGPGGVVASKFDQDVAEQQRVAATILKQNRLMTEEMDHESRKETTNKDKKHGGEDDAA